MKTTLHFQKRGALLLALLLLILFSSEAATKRFFCKMSYSWWTVDGAAIALYAWSSSGGNNAAWPGVRMTAVNGDANVWYADIDPALYTNCIFVRVNPTGAVADWGAKTKDLTMVADKDLFTISSSSEVWGNPGCDGTWSVYAIPTGVSSSSEKKQIIVSGSEVKAYFEGEQLVSIYSSVGSLLMQQKAIGSFTKELPEGIYIVHIGTDVHKIRITQ